MPCNARAVLILSIAESKTSRSGGDAQEHTWLRTCLLTVPGLKRHHVRCSPATFVSTHAGNRRLRASSGRREAQGLGLRPRNARVPSAHCIVVGDDSSPPVSALGSQLGVATGAASAVSREDGRLLSMAPALSTPPPHGARRLSRSVRKLGPIRGDSLDPGAVRRAATGWIASQRGPAGGWRHETAASD